MINYLEHKSNNNIKELSKDGDIYYVELKSPPVKEEYDIDDIEHLIHKCIDNGGEDDDRVVNLRTLIEDFLAL